MRAYSEWTTDELKALCLAIRSGSTPVIADHVDLIEELSSDLRDVRERNVGMSSPPSDTLRRLQVVGWLILEASLASVKRVTLRWESSDTEPDKARESAEHAQFVDRIAHAARGLGWREYCPRALGAIRAQALVASKRDTDSGFRRAWYLHEDADMLFDEYKQSATGDAKLLLQLREAFVMLQLAQAGTACRTAERTIAQTEPGRITSRAREKARLNQLFTDLERGVTAGDNAIGEVRSIDTEHGLVTRVDENRFVLDTAYRNPGIMTARAYLLMYPITALLEKQGRRTWRDLSSWSDVREEIIRGFVEAYQAIEYKRSQIPLTLDFERSIIQLRLNLAIVNPGCTLPSAFAFAPCLERTVLDDDAIEELSQWLATRLPNGTLRGDANVIGSAIMPSYLSAIRLVRGGTEKSWDAYCDWRLRWFELDKYAGEPGRRGLVTAALHSTIVT